MIRIYFEALEQGLHFVLPAVQKALGANTPVQLIKLSRLSRTSVVARRLMPSLGFKDPDAIITYVKAGQEIPLLWIEISTAVETQDHVLQRFDSQMASGFAGIPFVKVQARRASRADHGGQTNFDFKETFQILFSQFGIVSAQLEWPLSEDSTVAIRHKNYKACPDNDLGLGKLISASHQGVDSGLTANEALSKWAKNNPQDLLAQEITENQQPLQNYVVPRRSTRLFQIESDWVLKFNRWGHAMDPERGMAWYFSNRLGVKLKARLHCRDSTSALEAKNIFSQSTGIRLQGLELGAATKIDITAQVSQQTYNRAGLAIVANCSEFTVADANGRDLVTFFWAEMDNPIPIPKCETADCTELALYDEIGEDEVTFVSATQVFPLNEIEVQSVSYPGAQGDFALVQGSGRGALRTYIDLIGIKKTVGATKVFLLESKGSRAHDRIAEDTIKVLSWRDEYEKRQLLLSNMGLPGDSDVTAGTAYPGQELVAVNRANDLDFTVLVSNSKWVVWAPIGSESSSEFQVPTGKVDFPAIYEY